MRCVRLVIPVVAAVLFGCVPEGSPQLSDADRSAIADAVRARSEAWRDAAQRADADALMSYYRNDPSTVIIRSDQSLVSWDGLRNDLRSRFADLRSQTVLPRQQRIEVLGPEAAVESAVGEWISTDAAGTTEQEQFALTRVWVRRSGDWLILHSYLDVRSATDAPVPDAPRP